MLGQSRSQDPDTWDGDIWENVPRDFWLYRSNKASEVIDAAPFLPSKDYYFSLLEDATKTSPQQGSKCPF